MLFFLLFQNGQASNFELTEPFADVREEALLLSLEQIHGLSSINVDKFSLPNFPVPPNTFRGIRKKNSSLKRWFIICSDDITG